MNELPLHEVGQPDPGELVEVECVLPLRSDRHHLTADAMVQLAGLLEREHTRVYVGDPDSGLRRTDELLGYVQSAQAVPEQRKVRVLLRLSPLAWRPGEFSSAPNLEALYERGEVGFGLDAEVVQDVAGEGRDLRRVITRFRRVRGVNLVPTAGQARG